MKRTLPALLLCGVLLFSVPALTEDALLRSLFGWTAYFARIPADAPKHPIPSNGTGRGTASGARCSDIPHKKEEKSA